MQNGGGQSRTTTGKKPSQRHKTVSFPPFFVYSLAAGFQGKPSPFPGTAFFSLSTEKGREKKTKVTRGFSKKKLHLFPPLRGNAPRQQNIQFPSLLPLKVPKSGGGNPFTSPLLFLRPHPQNSQDLRKRRKEEEGAFISRD